MKYTVVQTAQFVRDVRRLRRRGLEISKLENVVGILSLGGILPRQFRDHALKVRTRGSASATSPRTGFSSTASEKGRSRLNLSERALTAMSVLRNSGNTPTRSRLARAYRVGIGM